MPDLRDYELQRTPGAPMTEPPRPAPSVPWLAAGGLIVAAAIAAYIVFFAGGPQAPSTTGTESKPVAMSEGRVRPLGGKTAAIDVPPLDRSDPLVRELLKQLTSHPSVAAWLTTDGLIRNFVLVVSTVADGKSASKQVPVLRPSARFRVAERTGGLSIDPRSYQRYDTLAAAAASIDAAGAARLFATLKPRIEEAYRDLGMPDTPFDRTLERAIVQLLGTPAVPDPIPVQQAGGFGYRFASAELEGLSPAQKQLLRMGPQNVRTIQSSLRAIAQALGIPADRLPAPPASR